MMSGLLQLSSRSSPCRADEQLRNVQQLQRRLDAAEGATSEARQQLAASRAAAHAAKAAVGIARKDTDALRGELRVQRGATAQVCHRLYSLGQWD